MNAIPSRPATDPVKLDERAVAKLFELDPGGRHGIVKRVLHAYENSLQRQLALAVDARDRGDAKALSHVAHTLKSASESVGALDFAARCVEIERAFRAGATLDLALEVENLLTQGERALDAVRAMLRA